MEMKRFFWKIPALVILTGFLFFSSSSYADKKEEAVKHYEAGKKLFQEKKYDDAISEFLLAYGLDPAPVHVYNIARSYEEKGEIIQAVEYFKRFIAMDVPDDQKKAAEERAKKLMVKDEERKLWGTIVLKCSEKGAKIYVDGLEKGMTPVEPFKTTAGNHKIVLKKEGFEDWGMEVKAITGEKIEVSVTMKPGKKVIETVVVKEEPKKTHEALVVKETPVFERKSTWGYISAGVGGACVAAGVIMTVLSQGDFSKLKNAKKDANGVYIDMTQKEAMNIKSSAESKQTMSYVFYGIGAAAAGAGLALILLDEGSPEAPPAVGKKTDLSITPVTDFNSAGLQASFTW
jgi:hypothetical protein